MHKLLAVFTFLFTAFFCHAQSDSADMVKFGNGVHFSDGVYANFSEWKNNLPRISEFHVVKDKALGGHEEVDLSYKCHSEEGSEQVCLVNNCFGYVKNGVFYISQGVYGRFFRVFIVGGLTHFIAYSGFDHPQSYRTFDPNGLISTTNDLHEYVLDFASGLVFEFSYKNFAPFLKTNDAELYQQLQASKNKRQMIHHFLLEFNKKHPIYIPERAAN